MTALVPLEASLFDSIAGLPAHPLVVHAAVVLLPLAALGLLVLLVVRRWRWTFGPLTLAGLAAGALAAFAAKESGEALAGHVGRPETHALLGTLLPPLALALFLVATLWFWLDRRASSGPSVSSTPTGGSDLVSTMEQVTQHADVTSCWSVVDGSVYDLTDWVSQHPGRLRPDSGALWHRRVAGIRGPAQRGQPAQGGPCLLPDRHVGLKSQNQLRATRTAA